MTVTSTRSVKTYTGNGATTIFAYDFEIPTATDVSVYLTNKSTGDITVLSTAQYSISGLGDPAFGSVTYPLSGPPLAATHKITIERVIPYTQPTSIPNQGNFFADTVELAIDRIVMMVQQVEELYARSLRVPMSDDEVSALVDSSLRANKTLTFDANGAPMVGDVTTAVVSAAMTAVIQAASLAAGRLALGIPAVMDPLVTAASLSAGIAALFTGQARIGSGVILSGTGVAINLASAASGRTSTSTVTVTGAVVGDIVLGVTASGDATTLGGFLTGMVTSANTVTIFYMNGTAGALDPASQDYTVRVLDISTLV